MTHRSPSRLALFLTAALALASSACTIRISNEVAEGLALGKMLHGLSAEAEELQHRENLAVNELRTILDQVGTGKFEEFRARFDASVDLLGGIRDRRRHIQSRIRQASWTTPLVRAVQADAVSMLQEEVGRNDAWIQMARNVRVRADLGRQDNFPEIPLLMRQLELFLGEIKDDPLRAQLLTLQSEYGFSDVDLSH